MEERGTSLRDLPRLLSPSLMVEPEEQRVAVETFSFLFFFFFSFFFFSFPFFFFFFFPSLVFFFLGLCTTRFKCSESSKVKSGDGQQRRMKFKK